MTSLPWDMSFQSQAYTGARSTSRRRELSTLQTDLQEGGPAPGDGEVGGQGAHALRVVEAEAHANQAAVVVLHITPHVEQMLSSP